MSYYYNHANYHHSRRYIKKFRKFIALTIVILLLAGIAAGINHGWDRLKQQDQKSTTSPTSGYYSAPVKVFRSQYFQFQTDESWSEVLNQSNDNVYVYRSMRKHIVDHELLVYVNTPAPNISFTHVLPVNLTSAGSLLPLKVSDHCANAFKPSEVKTTKIVTMEEVTFHCNPHDSAYTVLVGMKKGGGRLTLPRPDATSASFTIVYKNLTASPEGSQIEQIAETFQTR